MRLNKLFTTFILAALAMGAYACGDESSEGGSGNVGDACDATTYEQSCINDGANALVCVNDVVTQWDCTSCMDAGYDSSKPLQVKCEKGGNSGYNPCTATSTSGCAPACDPDGTKGYYWSNNDGLNTYACYSGKKCRINASNRVECFCPAGSSCGGESSETACTASSTSKCNPACDPDGSKGYYWSSNDGLKTYMCYDGKTCRINASNRVECFCPAGSSCNGGSSVVVNVGDIISFGKYEQDNNTTNGTETIQWRVLDKNDEGQYLIVSENVLDAKPFNTTNTHITWDKCTLRSWLNGYPASYNTVGTDFSNDNFIDAALTAQEKAKIVTSHVSADRNPYYPEYSPGNSTTDKIFLLSRNEANQYFATDKDRLAEATRYAVKRDAYVKGSASGTYSYDGTCTDAHCIAVWSLRSPDRHYKVDYDVTDFNTNDTVDFTGCAGCTSFTCDDVNIGIRPAMWVKF